METRPGSVARALVELIEWIDGYVGRAGEVAADWSGFPFDLCYFVMHMITLMLTPGAILICWEIIEAVAERCQAAAQRLMYRRRGG